MIYFFKPILRNWLQPHNSWLRMRHLAAYLLLVAGGNAAPTQADVTAVITAAGGEVDEQKLAALFADLEGKDIHTLVAEGDKALKSVVGVAAAPSGNHCVNALNVEFLVSRY